MSHSSSSVHVKIFSDFDGGNIEYVRQEPNRSDARVVDVILNIRPDVYTELEEIHHMQYFCFASTVTGVSDDSDEDGGVTVRYVIDNASSASYPEAWPGTSVCYTTTKDPHSDVDSWRRNVDTYYTQSQLHWEHVHAVDGETTYFSYFPIYSRKRHDELLTRCRDSPSCQEVLTLGQSIQGRDIDCVVAGTGALVVWIIHQQHPGETMAEHYAEGLLHRLLGLDESSASDKAVVDVVLGMYTFYIVPNMNPDGAFLGHLRTNAVGANLNREWADSVKKPYEAPTLERSPEVHCVLQKMKETGVDCFLDVHGDEELPFNFTSGSNGIPNWGPRLERLLGAFTNSYSRFNSDMQSTYGYPKLDSAHVAQYMNVATNQVGYRFDCLAVTLEMPFKDCRSNPDPHRGWSPARCRALGASLLQVLQYVHPHLRGDSWQSLPDEDRYIETTDDYSGDHGDQGEDRFQMLKQRFYSDVHEIRKPPTSVRSPQKAR